MAYVLTTFGAALCSAMVGAANPSYDDCAVALYASRPTCDSWGRCPSKVMHTPDRIPLTHSDGDCKAVATYDIFDGSKGTSYLCSRPASIVWLDDGRWAWKLGEGKP